MTNQLVKPVYALTGEKVGEVTLSEVFARPINRTFLSQVVVMSQKKARRPTSHTKGRGEVRGGGRKPWRQKGTGRARHGSIRSPIWKGGGVAHGPTKNRNLKIKINKKVRRGTLAMALAEKVRSDKVVIVQSFEGLKPKTKNFVSTLESLFKNSIPKRLLIVTAEPNPALLRASRNLKGASLKAADSVSVLDVLRAHNLIFSQDAFKILSERVL